MPIGILSAIYLPPSFVVDRNRSFDSGNPTLRVLRALAIRLIGDEDDARGSLLSMIVYKAVPRLDTKMPTIVKKMSL